MARPASIPVTVTLESGPPTQVAYPRRAAIRSAFQAFVGLCAIAPVVVAALLLGVDLTTAPGWLVTSIGVVIGVSAAVTRVMALPGVNAWIARFLPWLAPEPKPQPDVPAIIDRSLGK